MNPGFTHRETDVNPRYDHLTGYERDNHKKPVTDRCSPQILPAMISIPLTKLPLPRRKNKKLPEYFILYFFLIYNVCLFCFFCTSPIPVESFPSLFWPCCQPITTWLQHNQRAVGILEDCTAACSWWPEIPLCRQIHAQVDTTAVAVLYKTNPSESPHPSLCRYPQSFPLVALFWLLYVLITLSNPSQPGYVMWFMYVYIQFNVRDHAQKHSSNAKRCFVPHLARSSFPSAAPV